MQGRADITKLMNPSSIAVVGASTRSDAAGSAVIRNLDAIGFTGQVFPVNPRYDEIAGRRCYPSISDIHEAIDAVFIGVPAPMGPAILEEAGANGARAAYINASGYADGDEVGKQLQAEVGRIAQTYGLAVCGPNNTGLVNLHDRVAPWTGPPVNASPGPVAIITQSGSASLVLSEDPRRLGLAYVITAGNEAVTTIAEYLEHVVEDERVRTVLLFIETIRDAVRFAAAADQARRAGKRIIALKIGRSEVGRIAVMAHTGSLAGSDSTYDAFFRAHGVVRVFDFDEMIEAAVLFSAYPDPPRTPHVVPMTLSGGEAALVADLASETGVSIPEFSPQTRDRISTALPPFSQSARNPLDAFGLGWSLERFTVMIDALLDDPDVGVIVPAIDAPASGGGDADWAREMAELFESRASQTDKRFVIFNNSGDLGLDPGLDEILRRAGIPCLTGMREALLALGRWTHYKPLSTPTRLRALSRVNDEARSVLVDRTADEGAIFDALRGVGVPMVLTEAVATASGAAALAGRIGYPVAVKGVSPAIGHKAQVGLVFLGLSTPTAVRRAVHNIKTRFQELGLTGPQTSIVVQAMAPTGIELLVGTRADPLGSVVVVGSGGVDAEARRDVSIRMGPVGPDEAREMLSETEAGRSIYSMAARLGTEGVVSDVATAISTFSEIAAADDQRLSSLEMNPLIVAPDGSVHGVDLLREFNDGAQSIPR